jgi:pilus assembly protein CpaC
MPKTAEGVAQHSTNIPTMQAIRKKSVVPGILRTLSIVVIGLGALLPLEVGGQALSGAGLQPTLPIVPVGPPRNLESDQVVLPKPSHGPVAELLDSATTSDAILEVIVGHGRVLTTKEPIAKEGTTALVATGDPTVIDFEVAGPRLLRILGRRVGVTDLSITTDAGQTYTFEVHVIYDLPLLTAYLKQVFPDALIELKQLREHIVLQGQARSVEQITQIQQTLGVYLGSVQVKSQVTGRSSSRPEMVPQGLPQDQPVPQEEPGFAGPAPIDVPEDQPRVRGTFIGPQIINLMRVPGVQQVMLKVQLAELNRTALRQVGADIFIRDGSTTLGTQIGGSFASLTGLDLSPTTTAFGIFDNGDFQIFLSALRANGVASILAEPNLMALNGQEARFHAGGEFPVVVPQSLTDVPAVQFKDFGVIVNFVPTILDDETIRLRVSPEVSNIDTVIQIAGLAAGAPIFSTRNVQTTVELKQGQTLALAGLLQVELAANTRRIPGLGDLPYLGPLFSNTTHNRVEKELLVLVTPYLVSPMNACQAPPMPGSEVLDPNDCEFYFMNRIEGRTGTPHRSTTAWDDPCGWRYLMNLEHRQFCGPVGYSE